MDERDWQILKVLYERNNITKAAQDLYISQPALTNRLQQIEEEFKVKIVNRGKKGVHFTPQGEYLANTAEEVILKLRKIRENVLNLEENVTGTLRIGASKSVTKYKLPNLLRLFKLQYPNVNFVVKTGWSRDINNLVYNEDVHIGFVRGDYTWPDQKYLLFEERLCIASAQPVSLSDLPKLPRIDYQTDYLLKAIVDNWWTENYAQPPLISMEVDDVDTCKEMVINGLGYGIMSSLVLDGIEPIHRKEILHKNGEPLSRQTWMFYYGESLKMNVVKAFVQFIEQRAHV